MKLHFFGTCAGTEPLPGRNHQSMAIEINDTVYWFDAGSFCSSTAHFMGVDLLNIKSIIISHPHMDHVGGLGNLLWNIRKLKAMQGRDTKYPEIALHIPEMKTWEGFSMILQNTEGGFDGMTINASQVKDGVVFSDENMTVTAFHNRHLGIPQDNNWKSFTYLIEAEGKKVIYSGDLGGLDEIDAIIGDGCDALMMETGHHHYMDVCNYMKGKNIKNLFYTHNGRSILTDPQKALEDVQKAFDGNAVICSDGTTFELQ